MREDTTPQAAEEEAVTKEWLEDKFKSTSYKDGLTYDNARDAKKYAELAFRMADEVDTTTKTTAFVGAVVAVLLLFLLLGSCQNTSDILSHIQANSYENGSMLAYPAKGQTCMVRDNVIAGCFVDGE